MYNSSMSEESRKFSLPHWVFWYILFLGVILVWHVLMREYSGDAVEFFSKGLESDTLYNILSERYQTWSSRVFVEAILYLLAKNVTLWKVCNFIFYTIFAFCLLKLTDFQHPQLILGLWIIYPIAEMGSAGWIATYMNYFWPLVAVLYSSIALYKIYRGEKIYPIEWITYSIATLFSTNVEQVTILYGCVLFGFGIGFYLVKKTKRALGFYILQCMITLGNLRFIMLSPGNHMRTWKEIANWMHDFAMLSPVDKGVLGVVTTMNTLTTENLIFLIFVLMLFYLGIIKQYVTSEKIIGIKGIIFEICSCAPFLFTVVLSILKNTTSSYFAQIQSLFVNVIKIDAGNWNNGKYYIPFIVYMLMIIMILIALINLFDDLEKSIGLAWLFLTGLLTRVMLGFSPTLYASSKRTFIFLDALLILGIIQMYNWSEHMRGQIPKTIHKVVVYIYSMTLMLSMLNNTISICGKM